MPRLTIAADAEITSAPPFPTSHWLTSLYRQVLTRHARLLGPDAEADRRCAIMPEAWAAPCPSARLLIDSGWGADADFWAFVLPTLRCDDAVLVASDVCCELFERLCTSQRPQIYRVPFCVNLEMFCPDAREARRPSLCAELGLDPQAPLLLTVSSFLVDKNLEHAVDLAASVRERLGHCQLVVITARPDHDGARERLLAHAQARGMAADLRLLSEQPSSRIAAFMAAADALVHLSTCRIENFGYVIAEALACGLPVLASDWGGFRDLVREGENGHLATTVFEASGPTVRWRELIEPAVELLCSPATRERLGLAGRSFAERELSFARFERDVCKVLKDVQHGFGASAPAELSEAGKAIQAAAIILRATQPELSGTGAQFRALLDFDGGKTATLLRGAAASRPT
ncbi:MAG: glycosyltransferase [Myxococcales bacterium]|nr:glycosyltransferase [Myxococcales bacterium]